MRRTKNWWAKLTKPERYELISLEASNKYSGSCSYIPDDCCECGYCSTPHLGNRLCPLCDARLNSLITKANSLTAKENLHE